MSTTAADRKQGSDTPSSANELWTDTIMDSLASKGNATIKNSESVSDTKDREGNGHGKNTPSADEDGLQHNKMKSNQHYAITFFTCQTILL